jgi:hypothetical protein
MHGVATALGTAGTISALRLQGGSSWSLLAWYFVFFGAAHVVMVPILTAWFAVVDRIERWIRLVVERELIRIDLRTYQNTLERVFPGSVDARDETDSP